MLHIHCGDSSAEVLRTSGVPGDVIVWADVLHEGPTLAGLAPEDWRALRAKFLASTMAETVSAEHVAAWLKDKDEAMERFHEHEEVVLWFDACLYDQAILVRQLDWFSHRDLGGTTLSLICVGGFAGIAKFKGLGELNPEQMASLPEQRHEVTEEETELARKAWAAFCSPDPSAIERVVETDTSALPFLRDGLVRHLEQFPSMRNGLNRLEKEALEAVASGCSKLGEVFVATSDKEERPFFGDTTLWLCLERLASARAPALSIEGPGRLPRYGDMEPVKLDRWTINTTEMGLEVLAGRQDWVRLNGIDRWLGGVHLCGEEARWRWDEATRTLVQEVLAPSC